MKPMRFGRPIDAQYEWSPRAEQVLRIEWLFGKTAKQIVDLLPPDRHGKRATRGAVIGKVHRLGLSGRGRTGGKNDGGPVGEKEARLERAPKATRKAPPRPARQQSETTARPVEPLQVSLLDRRSNQCAWPTGTGPDGIATYCGHPVKNARFSWCAHHERVGLNPVQPRARKDIEKQDEDPQREAAFGFL